MKIFKYQNQNLKCIFHIQVTSFFSDNRECEVGSDCSFKSSSKFVDMDFYSYIYLLSYIDYIVQRA